MKYSIIIFLTCYTLYFLTNYGGIRSPDSEVVFRVAESLADNGTFSPKDIEMWPGFGVSPGKDGKLYSVYPPLESLFFVPVVKIGQVINLSHWFENIQPPVSHYVENGLEVFLFQKRMDHPMPHALRFIASLADVMVSVLVVLMLYLIILRLNHSKTVSMLLSLIYALGTFAWSYAGSFFSEPMATLWVLLSFYGILGIDPDIKPQLKTKYYVGLWSGIGLGLAVSTHYTALLFAPFFMVYLVRNTKFFLSPFEPRNGLWLGLWIAGFAVTLIGLGYYNYIRFGSFLESGRTLSALNQVEFVTLFSSSFWHNLYGLLIESSKGLLIFCPFAIISVFVWRSFHKTHSFLSKLLIGIIITRIVFIALYRDWHGGYGLGPRYLFMIIPMIFIPVAVWLKDKSYTSFRNKIPVTMVVLYGCIIQQFYFVIGEIFSFYHIIRFSNRSKNIDVFTDDRIYLDWNLTPLFNMHSFNRGPWLFQSLDVSNFTLWLTGCLLLAVLMIVVTYVITKKVTPYPTAIKAIRK